MKIAYLDCFSGVSGDMLLGALVDAGVPEDHLRQVVDALGLDQVHLSVCRQQVQGFAATRVMVEDHHHAQTSAHADDAQHPHHPHRHLADILALLDAATALSDRVRQQAAAVFTRLAEAEAAVHGTSVAAIHFHEVGAVDALVDIVGTVAGFDLLGVERIVCSPLPLTRGWVRCAHGEIPLPGPAVCRLLEGVPVAGEELDQELVTPTGAALVRELAATFGPLPPLQLSRTGYGAGTLTRHDGRPNLLRLMLGDAIQVAEAQEVEVVETHLDDWNPELWPHVSQRLLEAGALDVCLIPMQMKKGRPGFLLRVIGEPATRTAITSLLFVETSAIGLRIRREQRMTLPRETVQVATPWGDLPAKKILTPAGPVITPEYEVCRQVAVRHGVPLQHVYAAVQRHQSGREEQP